jgi:L-asparagine oxygenase
MQTKNKNDLRKLLALGSPKIFNSIILSDTNKARLFDEVEEISFDPYTEYNNIIDLLKNNTTVKNFFPFSKINNKENISVFFIQNLPLDSCLVSTPLDDEFCSNKQRTSEKIILSLVSSFGLSPYINLAEKGSYIIQNIIPIKGKENELSGAGSTVTFNWHTENIHEEHPANYFILFALRGDKNAFTSVMLVQDIVERLPKSMLGGLLSEPFVMKTGPTYSEEITFVRPILSLTKNGNYNIYYNSDVKRCLPISSHGERLYKSLQTIIHEEVPSYYISLKPGEAVIINNKLALHKRDSFQISTSFENRRWLQTVYMKSF